MNFQMVFGGAFLKSLKIIAKIFSKPAFRATRPSLTDLKNTFAQSSCILLNKSPNLNN